MWNCTLQLRHRSQCIGWSRLDVVGVCRAHVRVTQYRLNRFLSDAECVQIASKPAPSRVPAVPDWAGCVPLVLVISLEASSAIRLAVPAAIKSWLDYSVQDVVHAHRLAVRCGEDWPRFGIPAAKTMRVEHPCKWPIDRNRSPALACLGLRSVSSHIDCVTRISPSLLSSHRIPRMSPRRSPSEGCRCEDR